MRFWLIGCIILFYATGIALAVESSEKENPVSQYNRGVTLFRGKKFKEATEAFLLALVSGKKSLEEKSAYNTANSKYRLAETLEKSNIGTALKGYYEAAEYYKRAIELDSKDKDAKFNYEFTRKKISILEEKKQEEKQEKEEQGEKNEDKKEEKEQKSQEDKRSEQQEKEEKQQAEPQESEEQKAEKDEENQGSEDEKQGQMNKQEAMLLLMRQEEEENLMRMEKKEKRKAQNPVVVRDW